jgi:hypothetical protein
MSFENKLLDFITEPCHLYAMMQWLLTERLIEIEISKKVST